MNYKVSFYAALAAAVIAGVLAVVQMTLLNSQLADARDDEVEAQGEARESEDRLSDLQDDLSRAQQDLRDLRRAQEESAQALSLEEALASGKAEQTPGLSAEVSDFDCVNRPCNSIQGTATFVNETQEGSAVTCMFRMEFEDGTTSHFSWYSEYVPPKDEDVTDLYFSSNLPSSADFWYDSEDCYRGLATFNPGPGDI